MRLKRRSISNAEGGLPARTSSMLTTCSRREKAEYIVGRYAINKPTNIKPSMASVNANTVTTGVLEISNPSVKRDDPLKRKTANRSPTPNDQYIAAYPTKIRMYQVGRRSINPIGA